MATTKKTELVEIKPIERRIVALTIQGTTPLITHCWSAKARRQILETELKFPKTKAREPKNPIEDFCSSLYWLTPMPDEFTPEAVQAAFDNGARFGFPVTAFKKAAVEGTFRMGWSKNKTENRGAFFIQADQDGYYGADLRTDFELKKIDIVPNYYHLEPMVEIFSPEPPIMREDPVRVSNKSADLRYRAEFRNWSAKLNIDYNVNGKVTIAQIVNMFQAGGFACGVGEWRPEKDGQYGMFQIAPTE